MPNAISNDKVSASNLSTIQTSSALSATSEILTGLGFKDQRSVIYKADRIYQFAKQKLLSEIKAYEKEPSLTRCKNLIKILNREITRITNEYKLAKNKQIYYEKEIELFAKTTPNLNYASRFGNWVLGNVKQFFGSDNENLAMHYADIAKNREIQLEELKKYHSHLTQKQPVKKKNKSIKQKTSEMVTPKALSANAALIPSQFPASYSLSNLNGQVGAKFSGEHSYDWSGGSVSCAGDVNGDGVSDFLIGANSANSRVGASYVIFGHTGPWVTPFNLTNLNGTNGAKFLGENLNDQSGSSISGAGDVNGDGISDLIIGALDFNIDAGASYIVFGHTGPWITPFNLTNLNGTNGAKLLGNAGDESGFSVSGAGDVNGDGMSDIIIGAPNANYKTGASYVVFGHSGTWTTPFNLINLNGTNGARFMGENAGDQSGFSVSNADDVNGDGISDIIIGAPHANSAFGFSYIVFGHTGIWITPFSLSNLSGANGAKFVGDAIGLSGYSVSNAGDVNNDGISDCIIGAYYKSPGGTSYLVFGHQGNWTTPYSLSNLNGNNGAILLGNGASGTSVSSAGDLNGDEITDLIIGAPGNSNSGASYVIFGHAGTWVTPFSLSNLSGVNGVKFLGENSGDRSGYSVSNAGDVNGDGISDIIIGAFQAEANAGVSYVVFGDRLGYLFNNSPFTLFEGKSVLFNNSYLDATFNNVSPANIQFTISNLQHGCFEFVSQPGQTIINFTQQQVNSYQLRFVHDGSCAPPSYQLSANDGGLSFIPNIASSINFISINPMITKNNVVVNQNQALILATDNFNVSDPGDSFDNLQYTLSDIKHVQFSLISNPTALINQFTQQQINSGSVQLIVDNSGITPSYSVSVQDSCGLTTGPQAGNVTFFATNTNHDITNYIIGGCIAGGALLLFLFGLKYCCTKKPNEKVDNTLLLASYTSEFGETILNTESLNPPVDTDQKSSQLSLQIRSIPTTTQTDLKSEVYNPTSESFIQRVNHTQSQIMQNPKSSAVGGQNSSSSFVINYSELQITKELGKGGFGIVYQATYRFRPVAVKQLLTVNPSPESLEEFKSEGQVMLRLRSQDIVQFYGYCLNPYCIVMEYMPRGSLYSVLHNDKEVLGWETRYRMVTDIACGLSFLHSESILHRDLKSLNVLLDEHYRAKLTDFGLSKIKNESRSKSSAGGAVGTYAWMAPELISDDSHYTPKADIYSFAMVLWEIASRKTPFEKENPMLIPIKASQGKREEIPKDCPPKISSLIKFCWDADQNKRPTAKRIVEYLRAQDEKEFTETVVTPTNPVAMSAAAAQANYPTNLNSNMNANTSAAADYAGKEAMTFSK